MVKMCIIHTAHALQPEWLNYSDCTHTVPVPNIICSTVTKYSRQVADNELAEKKYSLSQAPKMDYLCASVFNVILA